MVLDSPFSDVKIMIQDTMKGLKNIPRGVTSMALWAMAGTLKSKTGYDVIKFKPIDCVKNITVPALYMVGDEDIISMKDRVESLYKQHSTKEKRFYVFEGEHHDTREDADMENGANFIKQFLNINKAQVIVRKTSGNIENGGKDKDDRYLGKSNSVPLNDFMSSLQFQPKVVSKVEGNGGNSDKENIQGDSFVENELCVKPKFFQSMIYEEDQEYNRGEVRIGSESTSEKMLKSKKDIVTENLGKNKKVLDSKFSASHKLDQKDLEASNNSNPKAKK